MRLIVRELSLRMRVNSVIPEYVFFPSPHLCLIVTEEKTKVKYEWKSVQTNPGFWATWNSFEIETGSEDTFREYLRIKRAVQSAFNTESSYLAAKAAAAVAGERADDDDGEMGEGGAVDPMAALEKATGGFVKAKEGGLKGAGGDDAVQAPVGNADEITMDDDDDDDDE